MQMFLRTTCLSYFIFISSMLIAENEPQIVNLTPPNLSSKTISQELICTRPMRDGRFNISLENYDKGLNPKKIVNCYGHGGSGWTTLFGSISKAIELFEESNPSKEVPIRVIGSGCMGLTAAIELTRLGYHVAITTKDLYDNPSWRAAGYFALVSVKTSPEEQKNLNEIGIKTFLTYQQIDKGEHPYLSQEAVRFIPVYCSEDTESGVEDLEMRGLIPPKEYVTLDFGNNVLHPGYLKYMTYFMDTSKLMRQLNAEVNRLSVPIEIQEIKSYDSIQEEVIFNCTGLGGRELNNDSSMIPVRGHLVVLNEGAGIEHMNYMIYTKVKQDEKEEYVYMFPKTASITPDNIEGTPCFSVLGGTFIPNVDRLSLEEQQQLDQQEFKRMLDRNSLFFYGYPFSE